MPSVNIYIRKSIYDRLVLYCNLKGKRMGQLINELLEKGLRELEKEIEVPGVTS